MLLGLGWSVLAQTPPVTPNVGLYLPAHGSYGWDTYYNSNWSLVDGLLSGLSSSTLKYVPPYTGAVSRTLNSKLSEQVSVKDFGATGNGTTNDTAAINAAFTASHNVFVPNGTYLITCDMPTDESGSSGGVAPQSNSMITFDGGATLKCAANTTGWMVALRLKNVSNVRVYGGILDGNRAGVTASGSTQWGMGLGSWGSSNVYVEGTIAQNAWGDGFYIGAGSSSITLNSVTGTNSRRNNLTVISVNGLLVLNPTFSGANGAAPQAGIDLEPFSSYTINNVTILNPQISGNAGDGIDMSGPTGNIQVIGGSVSSNTGAGILPNGNAGKTLGAVTISGVYIANNGGTGIYAINMNDGLLTLQDNFLIGNGSQGGPNGTGIENITVWKVAGPKIFQNTSRLGANTLKPDIGLQLLTNTAAQVYQNDLTGSGTNVDYYDTGTGTIVCLNRLSTGTQSCQSVTAASQTASAPNNAPITASVSGSGASYIYSVLPAGGDGSFTIGQSDPSASAYLLLRGGQLKSGDAGSAASGIQLLRGKASPGYQTMATFNDTATFNIPVNAASGFSVNSTAGLSVVKNVKGSDGNNCTQTFTGGILTASTCP